MSIGMKKAALLCAISTLGWAQENETLVDRVGTTGFLQLEASSFESLNPRQRQLAYWLTQASIAINPIIYDQLSRFGLRQKRVLELVAAHHEGVNNATYDKILAFTKLFWANRGNHNENTSQKFLPEFTPNDLKEAGLNALRHGGHGLMTESEFLKEMDELNQSLFDPNFEPAITAKSPRPGTDIIEASANNFYAGANSADLSKFTEHYPLNSRLAKVAGHLEEQVYRAGASDQRIPPGMYAEYLSKANTYLEKAAAVAEPEQAQVIHELIRFYQTGDPNDWLRFGADWVRNNAAVDFANGFIEVYRDARGAKGTSQSFVTVTDQRVNSMMVKIADHAQYFEDRAPWEPQYRKQGVKPPLAKAVEALVETGDFHVTTIGDNLPNENEIHEKYGSKSFIFTGSTRALYRAEGTKLLAEFAASREEFRICEHYGDEAEDLLTTLHEIIGHGSGRLSPKLTHDAGYYLKQYYSTIEEARADLMALWNAGDPKLRELGLVSSPDVATAMYYAAARVALTQLRRIPKGDTIEEDHQRGRQLIVNYIIDKTGAIKKVNRQGKTYIVISDFKKMRQGVGMLLAELMRIKAEGDYEAVKALIDRYAVHFDVALRDQVMARYQKLGIPSYWSGVNPDITALFGPKGEITRVDIQYPRDFVRQQLSYSAMYQHSR